MITGSVGFWVQGVKNDHWLRSFWVQGVKNDY